MANRRPKTVLVKKASIEQANTFLQTLPEKPREELSLREAVNRLRDPIRAALAKGYSYEEVAKLLADKGINISPSTLKNYVPSGGRQSAKDKAAAPATRGRRSKKAAEETTAEPAETAVAESSTEDSDAAPKKRNKVESVVEELLSPAVTEGVTDEDEQSQDTPSDDEEEEEEAPAPAKRGRRPGKNTAADAEPKTRARTAAKTRSTTNRRSRTIADKSTPAKPARKPSTRGRKKASDE